MKEIKVKKVNNDNWETCKNNMQKIKDEEKAKIAQIDQLVYVLYELTTDEKRIEDGKRE